MPLCIKRWLIAALLALATFCRVGASSERLAIVEESRFPANVVDIRWVGSHDSILLMHTQDGHLWRGNDASSSTWVDITDRIPIEHALVSYIVPSPADKNTVVILTTTHAYFISSDAGLTWRQLKLEGGSHMFRFHVSRPTWALMSSWTGGCSADATKNVEEGPCTHMLYMTRDLGKTFSLISSHVIQFSWGDHQWDQEDRIYFTHHRERKGHQQKLTRWLEEVDLSCIDPSDKQPVVTFRGGNKFVISNGFLLVAKLKDGTRQSVNLMVSADGGLEFRKVLLNSDLEEMSYYILDTSEGAVVLHVNHGKADGKIYVSDSTGSRYTVSLENNVRHAGECGFEKVMNLRGIYLANTLSKAAAESAPAASPVDPDAEFSTEAQTDRVVRWRRLLTKSRRLGGNSAPAPLANSVRTVISFDMGGRWENLKPPEVDSLGKKTECENPAECWLHLHDISDFGGSGTQFSPMYSYKSAIGIIMGSGNVGPYLSSDQSKANTYISRDGGLTWSEARKGVFIYEFGNHGSVLVMADMARPTGHSVFSWDEGASWQDVELARESLSVHNILTQPNARSTRFLLFGSRGQEGFIYYLDFNISGRRPCSGMFELDSSSSDYELWSPSDGQHKNKGCLMGKQMTYTRRKQQAKCLNNDEAILPVVHRTCTCTPEDYECEFGFKRENAVGFSKCIREMEPTTVPKKCTGTWGPLQSYREAEYRKIPGDVCEGGFAPTEGLFMCPKSGAYATITEINGHAIFVTLLLVFAFAAAMIVCALQTDFGSKMREFLSGMTPSAQSVGPSHYRGPRQYRAPSATVSSEMAGIS